MNLILIEPHELDEHRAVILTGARAAHVRSVLRALPGGTVRVGVLDGPIGTGTIRRIDDTGVEIGCEFEAAPPPRPRIDLLLALPRPKVMRRLWAQLAALGVGRVVLTNAARVERNYFDTTLLSPDVYRPLLIEGLQQARDTWLPTVAVRRQLKIFIEDELDDWFGEGVRLIADPSADVAVVDACAPVRERPDQRVLIAVGPEGGWNSFEIGLLQRHGFRAISLGTRTLRVDTACVALMAVVQAALARP